MLLATPGGLYCPAGGFHIDPPGAAELAVITHAHGDHARPGATRYVCASPGLAVLRRRLGPEAHIDPWAYGEIRRLGDVAWVSCLERNATADAEQIHTSLAQATNLFVRHDGRWRMVVHHASPVPFLTPQAARTGSLVN